MGLQFQGKSKSEMIHKPRGSPSSRETAGNVKRGALGKKIRANGGCLGYPEARKDVVSCEKARGTANRF